MTNEFHEDRNGVIRRGNGQFAPGQTGNPNGRPPRQVEERIRDLFDEQLTDDVIRALIRQALAGALRDGNRADREWISRYSFPKPAEQIDLQTNAPEATVVVWPGVNFMPDDPTLIPPDADVDILPPGEDDHA